MPDSQFPKAEFSYVMKRAIRYLGIADQNYPESTAINPNAPYTKLFLTEHIIKADEELCWLIASASDHPYRNEFFSNTDPLELISGSRIPTFMGTHGGVEIQVAATEENGAPSWIPGKLAQSFDHLMRTRDKSVNFPELLTSSSATLYWIENGKLELVDPTATGRVWTPVIFSSNPTDDEPFLKTPSPYANGLVGLTLSNVRPLGADANHRNDWTAIWAGYMQMISGNSLNLPEPERLQRIAT